MADDPKLNIGIQVTADTAGATEAKAAVQAVANSATVAEKALASPAPADALKQQAGAAREAAKETAEIGQRAEGAARAWEGLRMSAAGGIQQVVGLGKAASGALQAAFGAIPMARWLMLGSSLVAVVVTLIGHFREWFKTAEEGATHAQQPMESLADRIERLDRLRTDKLRGELDDITGAAKRAADQVDNLRTVTDALANAREAVALAEIRARADLTPAQKLAEEAKVRETSRQYQLEQAAGALAQQGRVNDRGMANRSDILAEAQAAEAEALRQYTALLTNDRETRAARLASIDAEMANLRDKMAGDSAFAQPSAEERKAYLAQYADAEKRRAAAKDALSEKELADYDKAVADAEKALKTRQTERDTTEKAAKEAEAAGQAAYAKLQAQYDALQATFAGQRAVEQIDYTSERVKEMQAEVAKQIAAGMGLPMSAYQPRPRGTKLDTYAPSPTTVPTALDDFFGPLDAKSATVDPAPMIEAVKKAAEAQKQQAEASNTAIQEAAGTIASAAAELPAPADVKPLVAAQAEYHAAVVEGFTATKQGLSDLKSQLAGQASEIRTLRSQIAASAQRS